MSGFRSNLHRAGLNAVGSIAFMTFLPASILALPGCAAADDIPLAFAKTEGVTAHVQSTFTPQGTFAFRAPYSGDRSLDPNGQAVETSTATGFFGARVWDGGELYFNPEIFHGFGLRNRAGTIGNVGLAGFSNGDVQGSGRWDAALNVARLYFSQTIGFGGETEDVKDDLNTVAGKRDISRLTLSFGKLAVNDVFDNNAYAHDPRSQFLNAAIWEGGAFDFAADGAGYTVGAVAELNRKTWAFRSGYFLVPRGGGKLDTDFSKRGSAVAELENRYDLFGEAGKLHLTGFANTVLSGDYAEAVRLSPGEPDTALTRGTRTKYGFVINAEQAIRDDLGVFVRYSWNDGKTEASSFTDIRESVSGGISLKGKAWNRPGDTVGLAGAWNAISPSARRYFAAGGAGLLIGDGGLSYAGEQIFEGYYSYAVSEKLALTIDYQHAGNPAYNASRGPVSILGGRIHVQF